MMYKALISFTGLVSMAVGEIREISDSSIAKDLLKAGYVEEVGETTPKIEKKAKSPRGGKKK